MSTAGYSKTPLSKKLGIKSSDSIKMVNAPSYYPDLFSDLSPTLFTNNNKIYKNNFIHFFTTRVEELSTLLPVLKKEIVQNGMIWVSWPKKTANIPTDVNENIIRDIAIKNGLVDIKVCAVDEVWSGLKLVIPVKDRK